MRKAAPSLSDPCLPVDICLAKYKWVKILSVLHTVKTDITLTSDWRTECQELYEELEEKYVEYLTKVSLTR